MTTAEQIPMRAVPGYYSSTPGIQIAIQTNHDATDEDLQFFQQLGVEWAMVGVRDRSLHGADFYKHLVKRFGDYGLKIYRITNLSVHNVPEITLNLPGRDAKVEEFKQFIRNLSAAGIKYNTYAHMANGIWSSTHVEGRGGMVSASHPDAAAEAGVPDTTILSSDRPIHKSISYDHPIL